MKRFQRTFFVLFLTVALLTELLVPDIAYSISIAKEEEMGWEFMKAISKQRIFIKDKIIVKYLEQVGQKIIQALPVQPLIYDFHIIKDDTYNAFAVPGGHVFINSGLFEAMDSEEELAGILAHEIAHVMCRHISKRFETSSKIGIATLVGLAAGVLLGIAGAGEAANALTIGSLAAGQQAALAYSREDERQADQIGLKSLFAAGYTPEGLLTILKKIRNKEWFSAGDIPPYLMTHPAVEERIIYLGSLLQKTASANSLPQKTVRLDFDRAHARLLILYGNKEEALKKFKNLAHLKDSDASTHYRYGLILARTGNNKDAILQFKTALVKRAFDSNILRDLGISYFYTGEYAKALKTLKSSVSIDSKDRESSLYLGRTLMALGKTQNAISTFEELDTENADDHALFYYMGKAYGRQKETGKAHYYLGIYYTEEKDFNNAVFHLKKARRYLKEDEKLKRIDKILKNIPTGKRRNRKG